MDRKTIKEKKKERLKIVQGMYLKGMAVTEIAMELGCASSTISSDIRQLGIRREKKDYENEILKLLKDGKTNIQICKQLGVCSDRIKKVRKKYGMGRQFVLTEENLIDGNTVYATDYSKVKLEKVTIDGKQYTDITPMLAPK